MTLNRWLFAPLASLLVIASDPGAAQQSSPDDFVDAINGVFGKHPGARAVHAKGIVLEGAFTPAPSAATVSKAAHLQSSPVPVVVRFSDFAGVPDIADNDGLASPRGLAVKFKLPDGSETDIVAHSFNGFPTATSEEFRALVVAIGVSGKDAPKPTPLDTFLESHPIAKAFLTAPKPAPVSYATLPYFGVNSFKFTNADGAVTFGRYQLLPVAGAQYLPENEAAAAKPDYLSQDIRERVAKAPVQFKLVLQIAEKDDKIDDPSIAWPDSRRTVELGAIEIAKPAADSAKAESDLVFMPATLTSGIEAADPMIDVRAGAYAVSFSRRRE